MLYTMEYFQNRLIVWPMFSFNRDLRIFKYELDCNTKVECILYLRKVEKICKVEDVISNFSWVVEIRFVNFGQEVLMGNLEKFLKVFIIPLIFSQIFIVIQTPSFHSYTIVFKRYVSKCVSAFCYMVFVYFWQIRLIRIDKKTIEVNVTFILVLTSYFIHLSIVLYHVFIVIYPNKFHATMNSHLYQEK